MTTLEQPWLDCDLCKALKKRWEEHPESQYLVVYPAVMCRKHSMEYAQQLNAFYAATHELLWPTQ